LPRHRRRPLGAVRRRAPREVAAARLAAPGRAARQPRRGGPARCRGCPAGGSGRRACGWQEAGAGSGALRPAGGCFAPPGEGEAAGVPGAAGAAAQGTLHAVQAQNQKLIKLLEGIQILGAASIGIEGAGGRRKTDEKIVQLMQFNVQKSTIFNSLRRTYTMAAEDFGPLLSADEGQRVLDLSAQLDQQLRDFRRAIDERRVDEVIINRTTYSAGEAELKLLQALQSSEALLQLLEAPRGDGRASPRRGVGRSESGGRSPAREEFRVRDYMRLDAEKKFFLVTTTSSVEGYDKILRYDLERLLMRLANAMVALCLRFAPAPRAGGHALTHLLTMLFFSLAVSCLIFAAHAHDTRAILGFDTNSLTELSGAAAG
ncbi:unnamed protein product, partial [Prorocentrum cordatum]